MADSGRLDELNRKFDENPRRYFAPLANEYRKAGELERAIELCRTYLPQQPGHMSGYIVYGQALFDAGRGDQAAAIFQQALTIDPENILALRYLGDIARQSGNSDSALKWYRRVVEVDPKNDEILFYISQLSSGAPVVPLSPTPPPAPYKVHPEPDSEAGAVVLSDLVHQPDQSLPAEIAHPDQKEDLPSISEFVVSARVEEPLEEPSYGTEGSELAPQEESEESGMHTPFMTETMAELYRQQGFTDRALEIYRHLAQESGDPGMLEKAHELEQQIEMERQSTALQPSSSDEEVVVAPNFTQQQPIVSVTVRDFFASIGAKSPQPTQQSPGTGGVLGELFSPTQLDGSDINAAAALASAYTTR